MFSSLFRAIWREIFPEPRPAGRDARSSRRGRSSWGPGGMQWTDLPPEGVNQATLDITGLVDALTHVALNRDTPLYQCQECRVLYQHASYQLVVRELGGRCVSCRNSSISLAMGGGGGGGGGVGGRNPVATLVNLGNYHAFLGQVVTFEGRVVKVLESSSGASYAAMFQDLPWREGFKMVVRERHLRSVGGPRFMRGLAYRTVRVRGLLTRHAIFGDQITVTDRAMIEGVS